MFNENLVLVGILLNAIGSISYIIAIIKGKIKPNRVTFFLFSLAPLIAFSAQVSQGVGIQSLLALSVGVFPLIIFISTFLNKKAYWKLKIFDLSCGVLSLLGLLLWYTTKVGDIAIAFSILADGLAALPTIIKAYKYPETEQGWPWFAGGLSGIFTLLTIKEWVFAQYGFPLYFAIMMITVGIFAQFKIGKRFKAR